MSHKFLQATDALLSFWKSYNMQCLNRTLSNAIFFILAFATTDLMHCQKAYGMFLYVFHQKRFKVIVSKVITFFTGVKQYIFVGVKKEQIFPAIQII